VSTDEQPPSTLGALARALAARFRRAGIASDEARLDAELLIRSVLGWDRGRWVAEAQSPIPPGLEHTSESLVARRVAREPMAYILGRCEFWGLDFAVSPAVLIPRPETEIVVEQALARMAGPGKATLSPATILDIGTGSGCLAISLAVEREDCRLVATDISAASIEVARRNAERHGVLDRIAFQQTPLVGQLGRDSVDIIVSNPPYVPLRDRATLPPEVREHEPSEALFAGDDGLDVVRSVLEASRGVLSRGGWLIFEFGWGQAEAVQGLINTSGWWDQPDVVADLQGIPRIAVARKRGLSPFYVF
jgi:release factor glutamine methyltransferase